MDLRGCEVWRHIRRLVANILLGRLAQFVKIPKWSSGMVGGHSLGIKIHVTKLFESLALSLWMDS